jgi:hypothetical protein
MTTDDSSSQDAGPDQPPEDHTDEVYVDTANLTETLLIVQSGSVDSYLQAIGIDPSTFSDEPPAVS